MTEAELTVLLYIYIRQKLIHSDNWNIAKQVQVKGQKKEMWENKEPIMKAYND